MAKRQSTYIMMCILVLAFALRVVVGIRKFFFGWQIFDVEMKNWWESGYTQLGTIAINFAEGRGLNFYDPSVGVIWSRRPPLYPLLLSLEYWLFGKSSLVPVLFQALIGTASVLMVYLIARQICSEKVGFVAASMAMVYPYYVSHDTALQETSLFTLLTAVTVFFLLRSARSNSYRDYVFSGLFLGLSSLCKESILAFIPFAVLWVYLISRHRLLQTTLRVLLLLMSFFVVITPWVARNAVIHGKPVFTIGLGIRLWEGHNPYTLSKYPRVSIDRSSERAKASLSISDRAEFLNSGEVKYDRWCLQRALHFMKENPLTVANYAITKVLTGFSPIISPAGESPLRSILYTFSYTPILLLTFIGAVLGSSRWRELSIFYFLFLSFAGVSAVAYAHTAHRVYLDIYLMILGSYAFLRITESWGVNWAKGASQERGVRCF